jgi:hypothetical protein
MIRRASLAVSSMVLLLAASPARGAYSPATTNGWFIVAGRVVGFGGAQFRTDVWFFNPDAANSATFTLTFHGQLLSTVPADGQVGALEWFSNIPIMGGMRSFTAPSGCTGGTFGAFQPGIPTTEAMTPKQSPTDSSNVLQMFGTNSGDPNYRTQVDVTNTSPVAVQIEVRVIDPVTAVIYGGTQTFSVAPKSLLRLGRILETVSAPLTDGLRVTVAIAYGTVVPTGGVLSVAATLDNRSQDQYAFVGQRQSGTVVPAEALPLEAIP